MAVGTAGLAVSDGVVVDGLNIDIGSGSIDQVDIFQSVANGAIGTAPTPFMFGGGECQAGGRFQQIPKIFSTIVARPAAGDRDKSTDR